MLVLIDGNGSVGVQCVMVVHRRVNGTGNGWGPHNNAVNYDIYTRTDDGTVRLDVQNYYEKLRARF